MSAVGSSEVAVDRNSLRCRLQRVKRIFNRAIRAITRSEFSARVDAIHVASRATMARMSAEGKGWEGLKGNVSLLGLRMDSGSRAKRVFGGRR